MYFSDRTLTCLALARYFPIRKKAQKEERKGREGKGGKRTIFMTDKYILSHLNILYPICHLLYKWVLVKDSFLNLLHTK
jgi:hypothetical protein